LFKSVMKSQDLETGILDYIPRAINLDVPLQALSFLKDQKDDDSPQFTLSQMVSDQTGLSELEKKSFQEKVEAGVLQTLKEVEEKAYAQAYALGMADGEKKAFSESNLEIKTALEKLVHLGEELAHIKTDLIIKNEAHILQTIFFIAKSLAMREIAADETAIVQVVKRAIENAQSEEEVTIKLNPLDQAFLEKVKSEPGHLFEKIQKVKLEVNENIMRGGCLVETNYGLIDATIEQRVSKLWAALDAKIPRLVSNE
jgi:flagellar assembly protein FliH